MNALPEPRVSGVASAAPRVSSLASVAIFIAGLYLARDVLVPVASAVLLSFLFTPVVMRLERLRIGRVASVIIGVTLCFAVIGGVLYVAGRQMAHLASNLPEYQDNIQGKIDRVRDQFSGMLNQATQTVGSIGVTAEAIAEPTPTGTDEAPVKVEVVERSATFQLVRSALGPVLPGLAMTGIVVVLTFFLLIFREEVRDRMIRLFGHGRLNITTQAMNEAGERVSSFLVARIIVNGLTGAAVGIGLFLLGVPTAALWGFLAFMLRFIPFLGPWLAAILPLSLSIATAPGFAQPLAVLGLILAIELFSNNVLEPMFYGRRTGVTPLALIMAAVFWGWLWGAMGLVLATPLTVCASVLGKYFPPLSFLNVLVTDEPVLEPSVRFYQRLLVNDTDEATDMLDTQLADRPAVEVYDNLLIPVLIALGDDVHRHQLRPERAAHMRTVIQELVEDLGEHKAAVEALAPAARSNGQAIYKPPEPLTVPLTLVPARDVSDDIACLMLQQALLANGMKAHLATTDQLASERVEQVISAGSEWVCVCAVPPVPSTHTRYLCKRLRQRKPDLHVYIAILGTTNGKDRLRQRIRCADKDEISLSLQATTQALTHALQPFVLQARKPAPPPAEVAAIE